MSARFAPPFPERRIHLGDNRLAFGNLPSVEKAKRKSMVGAHQSWFIFFLELVHQPFGNSLTVQVNHAALRRRDYMEPGVAFGAVDGQSIQPLHRCAHSRIVDAGGSYECSFSNCFTVAAYPQSTEEMSVAAY